MAREIKYYIVAANALPEIFVKVAEAKRLLETGEKTTVNGAAREVGISRSAFYKYKDAVHPFQDMLHGRIVTLQTVLRDEPGVLSGVTMVFIPSVSTFVISRLLGGGTQMMLGDLIEQQFLGGAYNPQLGAAIALVMMAIVVVCMLVMNRFGDGEEQAVML